MASITNRTFGAGLNWAKFIASFVGRIAAWHDANVTKRALNKLSDRDLEDLGLVRGDIDRVAEGRFTR